MAITSPKKWYVGVRHFTSYTCLLDYSLHMFLKNCTLAGMQMWVFPFASFCSIGKSSFLLLFIYSFN